LIGLRDVITFQGDTVAQAQQASHDSVDDYLEFCAERAEAPEKPFSGKFLLQIRPELHRTLACQAEARGMSLNALVEQVLAEKFADPIPEAAAVGRPLSGGRPKKSARRSSAELTDSVPIAAQVGKASAKTRQRSGKPGAIPAQAKRRGSIGATDVPSMVDAPRLDRHGSPPWVAAGQGILDGLAEPGSRTFGGSFHLAGHLDLDGLEVIHRVERAAPDALRRGPSEPFDDPPCGLGGVAADEAALGGVESMRSIRLRPPRSPARPAAAAPGAVARITGTVVGRVRRGPSSTRRHLLPLDDLQQCAGGDDQGRGAQHQPERTLHHDQAGEGGRPRYLLEQGALDACERTGEAHELTGIWARMPIPPCPVGFPVWRFVIPYADGTIMNVALGGKDIGKAFSELRRYYWNPETPGAIGVWHNYALVARVLPVFNVETERNEPLLQLWP
jgi:predicted HicB family RNase H-like nuclease